MKKTALVMLSILALVTLSAVPIKPSHAGLEKIAWINPTYRGNDYYLGWVVAFEAGTNWEVSVMIENDYNPPGPATEAQLNISTIIMWFSWGKNYTHRYSTPQTLAPGDTRVFTVSNMTPSTSEVPEIWVYSYMMYVEIVNATSGPLGVVTTWTWGAWDYQFAVYSSNHLQAEQLYDKLQPIFGGSTPMFPFFNISEAVVRYIEAYFEYQMGTQAHTTGDFSSANEHYGNAEALFEEALSIYEERGTAMEDAELNSTNYNAQANLILANAAMMNSYAWMFFGIGWILIGIGVIIFGAKKPKPT